jgi:hypothetical protein
MAKETKVPAGAPQSGAVTTYDWSSTGATGFEGTRQEDLGVPFLSILQDLSPQIRKSDPNYATKKIDGAQPGDIINSLTNTIVWRGGDEPMSFIPCWHERMYVEWKAKRGGFVKAHKNIAILNECKRDADGNDVLGNGNVIMTTSYFFGYAIMKGEKLNCVIGMTSAGLKEARDWINSMMAIRLQGPKGSYQPPMFSHIYGLSSTLKRKDNNAWFAWLIQNKGQLQDPVLIGEAINLAKVQAAQARQALPPPVDSKQGHTDDNVPFA